MLLVLAIHRISFLLLRFGLFNRKTMKLSCSMAIQHS